MKHTTQIRFIMKNDPICVTANDTLSDDMLRKLKHLVFHTSGKSYSDFALHSIPARDIMHVDPIHLSEEDTIDYASELFLQGKFHCLPVVDVNSRPIGIVTPHDLLKAYYQQA